MEGAEGMGLESSSDDDLCSAIERIYLAGKIA
jgi:hypothetical protein